jgi:O6-methylguanine-DNA--protein-cysteine methyltransferase
MGSQGQITGYAGGIWRKQALLKLENASISQQKH